MVILGKWGSIPVCCSFPNHGQPVLPTGGKGNRGTIVFSAFLPSGDIYPGNVEPGARGYNASGSFRGSSGTSPPSGCPG